jgi:PEGA domain
MIRFLRIVPLSLLSLGFLVALERPSPAQAVDPVVEMREHFDKGQTAYQNKNFELAAREFHAAYEAKPSAPLLYDEAVCYEKMKDYRKAVDLYRQYLVKQPEAKDRAATEERIKTLEATLTQKPGTQVAPPPPPADPHGFVLVETQPPGAIVYLDNLKDAPLGPSPWSGPIEGRHKIIVQAPGYKQVETDIVGDPKVAVRQLIVLAEKGNLAWVEVRANVAGADIFLDDKTAGAINRTPFMGNVTPGEHTVYVSKLGFTEETKKITLVGGEVYKLDFTLDKGHYGVIHVSGTSIEGAVVRLDGKIACQPAPCQFQSPDGEHSISVEKQGLKTYSRKMNVQRASETELSVKLMPDEGHSDVWWKYGFAAAFIGGGVVLGLQANSTYDDINNDIQKGMPPIGPNDDRFTRGKVFTYAADACFVIGGITAIVGTISLLSEKGPPSVGSAETRELGAMRPSSSLIPKFEPQLGPGYAGATMEVRW